MPPSLIEKPAPLPFVAKSRAVLGEQAAEDIAYELRRRLHSQQGVRMIFAASPSQSEMLSGLILMPGVDWSRVTAFHMDEFPSVTSEAQASCGHRLVASIGVTNDGASDRFHNQRRSGSKRSWTCRDSSNCACDPGSI